MIVKEEIKGCKLYTVPLGGLFKFGDRFLIKTSPCCLEDNRYINCVDVKRGYYTFIDDFALVEYLPDAFIAVRDK